GCVETCSCHQREHVRDGGVCDVTSLAIQNKMRAVLARARLHLHVRGVGTGFLLRECERSELFPSNQLREPLLFLLVRSKEQQRANADRMMRVYKNRCGRAAASDFLQHL